MMKKFFAVLAMFATVATLVLAAPAKEEAEPAARSWLALIDSGKYEDSWTESSSMFRSALSAQDWAKSVKGVREPMGPLKSRKLLKITMATSLPGAPDGEYA